MRCLITGCALHSPQEGWCAWGDLHEVGNCYVFNSTLKNGEMFRQYDNPPPEGIKTLILHETFSLQYFERRGVLVVEKSLASLNQAAQEYIK